MKLHRLTCAASAAFTLLGSHAAEPDTLSAITVSARRLSAPLSSPVTQSDPATWLSSLPGFSVWSAGGVSGLPALRGLADDRIKVLVDDIDLASACANHMNAPLSYVEPTAIQSLTVHAGVSPVSAGGDNIGGTLALRTTKPVFATEADTLRTDGQLSLATRSVDRGWSGAVRFGVASDTVRLDYSGSTVEARSYRDGHGRVVRDTLYKQTHHRLNLAAQRGGDLWTFSLTDQMVPYQGFPNQYMDMTHNHANAARLGYEGAFDWGRLEARLYAQNTRHAMGFPSSERTGSMPMNTEGRDTGYSLKAERAAWDGTLRFGHELNQQTLDDWWPPVPGSMMMSPQTYVNIQNGRRDRVALYGEWEGPLADGWSGIGGLRYEAVRTSAGPVQGYGCGMMCAPDNAAAAAFNAADRTRRDDNVDASLLLRKATSAQQSVELGLARKTRSPNLYERYSWGRGSMAMTMIGWFGDGNGYVGDIALRPEVAHTVSATVDWHDAARDSWSLQLTPYASYVKDYIDADPIGSFNPYRRTTETRNLLRFANHDARLFGANLSGSWLAWRSADWGQWTWQGKLDWTRGHRTDGGALYRMMPLNLALALEHRLGPWRNFVQMQAVDRKRHVDARRDEDVTPGYTLFNLGTAYQATPDLTLLLTVRNLFDRAYALPQGGVNLAEFKMTSATTLSPLQGPGRSIDLGLTWRF